MKTYLQRAAGEKATLSTVYEIDGKGALRVLTMSKLSSRAHTEALILKRPEGNLKAAICFFHLPVSVSLEGLGEDLHHQEAAYYSTLKFETRQRSYLIGRYAAKQAVASLVQEKDLRKILIEQGIFSQPVVRCGDERNIQVSITHCEELGAAVAFPEAHPMGIDLQEIDAKRREVIESQATAAEKKIVSSLSCPYDTLLTLLWTAKEALSKVIKTGLTSPFTIFEMRTIEIQEDFFVGYFRNFAQYKTLSFEIDHHVCSLVFPKKTQIEIDPRAFGAER